MTHKEIRKLTQIAAQQQETIKNLEKRLEETQQEVRDVKTQMDELNHQLDEIKNNQTTITSPRGSYADVVRTPPTSQPSNVRTLSSINMTLSSFTNTLFCTIDTSCRVTVNDWSKHADQRGLSIISANSALAIKSAKSMLPQFVFLFVVPLIWLLESIPC